MIRVAWSAAIVVALWTVPALAHACPSCFAGVENREAYFLTFVFLTLLPLALLGGVAWWIRGLIKEREEERRAASSETPRHEPGGVATVHRLHPEAPPRET